MLFRSVNGGEQVRSFVHINDLCRFYLRALIVLNGGAINVVAENLTVLALAEKIAAETGASIDQGPRTDDRSYAVSNKKLSEWGFLCQNLL